MSLFLKRQRSFYPKQLFSYFLFFLLTSNIQAQTATAPSGTGTSLDPYLIATLNNLYWITQNSAQWSKYYKQTVDIDASSSSSWASGAGFSPIGNATTKFTGNYDGDGHTVTGLTINRSASDYQAFFGYANAATIANLSITSVNITGNGRSGGLIGQAENSTNISKCGVTGTITGNNYFVAGLVGFADNITVSYCYTTGSVTINSGGGNAAGLIGYFNGSSVSNSYSQANAFCTGNRVGGLIAAQFAGSITNCYSTGTASTGNGQAGGLQGFYNSGTITNCFWDKQTSGLTTNAQGGTGKTTAEMKTLSTFTAAGWDFQCETTNGTNDYWGINGSFNNGYPALSWQGVTQNCSLPLTWLNFTVQKQGSNALLNWSTATEINTKDYVVEHSTNGTDWQSIGTVAAAGNSTIVQNYQYLHTQPLNGLNYYRLQQRDIDGKSSYSKIVSISFTGTEISVYPNPVINGQLNVQLTQAAIINIYNNQGKLELSRQLPAGLNKIDVSNLLKGIYRVRAGGEIVSVMIQ